MLIDLYVIPVITFRYVREVQCESCVCVEIYSAMSCGVNTPLECCPEAGTYVFKLSEALVCLFNWTCSWPLLYRIYISSLLFQHKFAGSQLIKADYVHLSVNQNPPVL